MSGHGSHYDVTTEKLVNDIPTFTKLATGGGSHDLNSFPNCKWMMPFL